jgi:hypothetical protein
MMEFDEKCNLDPTIPLNNPFNRYNIHLATLAIINLYAVMMSQSGDIACKSESQCITELKEIKQKVAEPVWEFDQRFKTLTG